MNVKLHLLYIYIHYAHMVRTSAQENQQKG